MDFRVLGPLEVVDGRGRPVAVNGDRLRALLAMLVLRAGESVSRDRLAEVLWGERPPAGATNTLQVQISKLRRLLRVGDEASSVVTTPAGYLLDVPVSSIDAGRFEALHAAGRAHAVEARWASASTSLAAALDLWRGEVLADFPFEDFAEGARTRLGEARLVCVEERIDADLALGGGAELSGELEELVARHPLRERLAGQLMIVHYRSGRQADALRVFQRTRSTLVEDLGIGPGPELVELERRVLDQDPALLGTRDRRATVTVAPTVQAPRTACVGREVDVSSLVSELARRRLITVVGPGGVGKTRLVLEVAAALTGAGAGQVWVVELGPMGGPSGVDDALMQTFAPMLGSGFGSAAAESIVDRVAALLGASNTLLLVDNCEHLVADASRVIDTLLRVCPGLRVLATSREPLRSDGEVVHELRPLALEDAVALFVARATEASTRFRMDDEARRSVERVCARLEGLPLAIELAAARTRAFTVEQLERRLRDDVGILGSAMRGRPSRHATLHAAVSWSHDLLFDDERVLLRSLAVFAGGFTLEAAEAVAGGVSTSSSDTADVLGRLVDKSLVLRYDRIDGPRYRLLQPVADFAAEQLEIMGETSPMRDRHLQWLADWTDGASDALRGPDQDRWRRLLRDEEPNLARAERWTLSAGDPVLGLRIVANLGWYVFITSRLSDYFTMSQRILAVAPHAPAALRARLIGYAGLLGFGREGSGGLAATAVQAARELGDDRLLGELAALQAMPLAVTPGQGEHAHSLILEARGAAARCRDRWVDCFARGLDGTRIYVGGDPAAASVTLEEVSTDFRRLGDRFTVALVDIRLSDATEMTGNIDKAAAAVDAALDGIDDQWSTIAVVLRGRQAWFATRRGDLDRALPLAMDAYVPDDQPCHRIVRAASWFVTGAACGRCGEDSRARIELGRAIDFYTEFGFPRERAMALSELGRVEVRAGNLAAGVGLHRAAFAAALEPGLPTVVASCLEALAAGLAATGEHFVAARALGAAVALLDAAGASVTSAELTARAVLRNELVESLGVTAAAGAVAAGALIAAGDVAALIR